jgi:hypothetical protein
MHIPSNVETRRLAAARAGELWQEYLGIRHRTMELVAPLSTELLRPVTSGSSR